MHDRDAWVIMPLMGNLVLLGATWFAAPFSFPHDGVSCTLVAAAASFVSFVAVLGYVVGDIGTPKSFASMVIQSVLVCMIYTLIYFYGGVSEKGLTFSEAFYFSVVTWTSLGYENLVPKDGIMLVTAFEAVTGYVFLGLLISLLASLVGRTKSVPEQL